MGPSSSSTNGVIGEYIRLVFLACKGRPSYIFDELKRDQNTTTVSEPFAYLQERASSWSGPHHGDLRIGLTITTWTPGTPDVFTPEGILVRLEDRVRHHKLVAGASEDNPGNLGSTGDLSASDDHAAATALRDPTRSGGVMVVSVPAMPELYSEFDAVQGHRRRYRPADLRAAFDPSRLVIEQLFW
jgi:hypothetical protein